MPAFLYKLQCSYEWPLGLPSRLNPLGMMGDIAIKTYLEEDLITTAINKFCFTFTCCCILSVTALYLWCIFWGSYFHLIHYCFHYSNRTLIMFFLREVFPSYASSLISLKITYWVSRLVNFLSGIFESWRVNSEKMGQHMDLTHPLPSPPLPPLPSSPLPPPLIFAPTHHLRCLLKQSPIISIL